MVLSLTSSKHCLMTPKCDVSPQMWYCVSPESQRKTMLHLLGADHYIYNGIDIPKGE